MPKTIQIRGVPDDVYRALNRQAAKAGMSLSDFLLRRISKDVHVVEEPKLTLGEWFQRLRRLEPVELDEDPAVTIRRMRGPLREP